MDDPSHRSKPGFEAKRRAGARGADLPRGVRERERTFAARLEVFKRVYRWLNLTLVQQGIWPLLIVLAAAPVAPVAGTPMPWWLARAGAPALAALLAWIYLRQRPETEDAWEQPGSVDTGFASGDGAGAANAATFPGGIGWVLPGLALMLAVARIVAGPVEPAAKLILFGVADVAAYQLIHFGVVRRSWHDEQAGTLAAIALFAASWGLQHVFLAAATGRLLDPWLAFAAAAAAGLAVAIVSWAARRWLGGPWPAAAAHLIVVYLILGFA